MFGIRAIFYLAFRVSNQFIQLASAFYLHVLDMVSGNSVSFSTEPVRGLKPCIATHL
jgi:hypothetical protein